MSRFFVILLTATVSLFFNACQKEPDPREIQDPVYDCIHNTTYYYDDGRPYDSSVNTYNGNQLIRTDMDGFYYTYQYANNKIIRKNSHFARTNAIDGYESYSYNADGTIAEMKGYSNPNDINPTNGTQFVYSGGKLSSVIEKFDITLTGAPLSVLSKSTYTYTGNNITKVVYDTYNLSTQLLDTSDTLIYNYDLNANYFKKLGTNILYTDYIFESFNGTSLPLFLSENNCTSIIENNSTTIPLTYTITEKKFLKEFSIDGELYSGYKYNCK